MIEGGAITTKDKWDGLFAKYTGDNYVPTYEASGSDVVPDVEFPGSAVLEKAALAKMYLLHLKKKIVKLIRIFGLGLLLKMAQQSSLQIKALIVHIL